MKAFLYDSLNPLFSSFLSLYLITFLYLPPFFLYLFFSPVFISATLLLLSILRLGAAQQPHPIPLKHESGSPTHAPQLPDPDPGPTSRVSFMEWDVGAPLEVIQEACCEGEEEPEPEQEEELQDDAVSAQPSVFAGDHRFGNLLQRYPSLSNYYPETDSDSESDSCSSMEGEFPVIGRSEYSPGFRWARGEFEEEKYGLIEIQIDGDCGKNKVVEQFEFHTEEDNFIEIDISPVTAGDR